MRIREYTPSDFEALRRLHAAQGFGYPLPDLESPLFVSKLVLEDSREVVAEGREEANASSPLAANADPLTGSAHGDLPLTMAILVRLTAETYLLHDPSAGTPPPRVGSTTCKLFSRRGLRARSPAALSASAGGAIRGPAFRGESHSTDFPLLGTCIGAVH